MRNSVPALTNQFFSNVLYFRDRECGTRRDATKRDADVETDRNITPQRTFAKRRGNDDTPAIPLFALPSPHACNDGDDDDDESGNA